jgi:hypothetical protein
VLAALPRRESLPLRWGAIIGAVCLIGASLAWTIRIPQARVQLNITTASIFVRLADDFSWDGNWRINPEQVRLQQFTHLDLPPEYGTPESFAREASLDLSVTAGSVRLRHLSVAHGALMTIASETDATDIVVRDAPFSGDIDVSGAVVGSVGSTLGVRLPRESFDPDMPPGRFEFQYDGRSELPALLHISPADTLDLHREIAVSGLGFFEEHTGGSQGSAFTSAIISGTLTMTDTGEHIPLVPAAGLRLDDARGFVTALKVTPKDVQVMFEGTASCVRLGTGDFARNLKPTILEWLFHQQKLGFFWGAITFLWGIAWSARKFFFGN